jgi:hypothetical protein
MRRFAANRLPADIMQELKLGPGERVLAWSPLVGGGAAAATVGGLHVVTPLGQSLQRPWAQVRQASWEAASGTLAVTWVSSVREITPLELTAPGRLPEVVHERVRSSLLLSQEVAEPGGRSVWVALRRATDGAMVTQVVPAPGVRLDDPEVAARVRRAEAALRDEAGAAFDTVRDADPA